MLAIAVAYSWGKAWIGVIAICCAAALAIFGLHGSSGRAYSADSTPTLFVTDGCSRAVTAYPAASNGDISPLAPAPTGLAQPQYVAVDKNGNIYATNLCTRTITIYTKGSKGNAAPIAIIGGSNTGLSSPEGIAVDSGGNIYVADLGRRQPVRLSAAGKQHRVAQRGPHRYHQREQHRPECSGRHRAGFQPQHLRGGCRRQQRACLSAAGKQHRVAQ